MRHSVYIILYYIGLFTQIGDIRYCMMSGGIPCRLLMLLIVINGVSAFVEVIGAGATIPAGLYRAWMAAYRSMRRPFVDVRLRYYAESSGFGKRAIASRLVSYAGSDSLLSDADYEKYRDLQMFPTAAMSVLRNVDWFIVLHVITHYHFIRLTALTDAFQEKKINCVTASWKSTNFATTFRSQCQIFPLLFDSYIVVHKKSAFLLFAR